MGLQVRINGFQMDLAAKAKLSMELFNPHLMYDSIPQNVIKAPVFPILRKIDKFLVGGMSLSRVGKRAITLGSTSTMVS